MKNSCSIFVCLLYLTAHSVRSQMPKKITTADYQRAVTMLDGNLDKYIDNDIRPRWTQDNRLTFRQLNATGSTYQLFDPASGKSVAASSLKELMDKAAVKPEPTTGSYNEITSPDGKKTAYIKNWNLWVRDVTTGTEKALTTDGVKDFGYATDNAGWKHSDKAILSWSPDSKKIATFQQDQRHVSDMYLVKTKVGAPELEQWKYPITADKDIIRIHRVIIDVEKPSVIRLKMSPDARRGTLCDDISCEGGFDDNAWSDDSKKLVFVSTSRDHKQANVRIADTATGQVSDIFEEKVATQYESGQGAINWKYFSATNEIIWYSERTDWGHLYLYDAVTGKLKNQLTSGDWVVKEVINVDEKNRTIYFLAGGKEANVNPYFDYLYKVGFDGKNLELLTPERGNHVVRLSPNKLYFTDSYAQPDVPPVHQVRDVTGKLLTTLAKTDVTRLKATGWKPVQTFTVKSANNKWDLYGLMYTPANVDASKKYPVIVYIYPGPQSGSVGSWNFIAGRRDNQALAELGFVVIALEGSCNPGRSKSFHDACYGDMNSNTLPDQIAGLKQLKARYNFLDLDKVGIWGHSGGGFATAAAMFQYPDFFKVGIAESGNHDNRNYEDDWGERYNGLETVDANGVSNYEAQANQTLAKNLKGKLLLIHGGMDDNVPPYNSYLVADALIKANKDFDFFLLPNARHGYGADSYYIMKKRWNYFVEHLMKAEPPQDFKIEIKPDERLK